MKIRSIILDLLNVESFRIVCFDVAITSFCVLPLLNKKKC